MTLDNSLAFFDIDSLEYRQDFPERASALPRLSFRERMLPLAPKLDWLYRRSRDGRHPLLFSVCCSGRVPPAGEVPGLLPIPAGHDRDDGDWAGRVDGRRLFLVEKARQVPGGNFVEDMHDKFRLNANLERLIRHLAPREWVVFGNGAAYCVHPVLSLLLDAGQKIVILSDVMVDNAGGEGEESPDVLRAAMLAGMAARGAGICGFDEFRERLART